MCESQEHSSLNSTALDPFQNVGASPPIFLLSPKNLPLLILQLLILSPETFDFSLFQNLLCQLSWFISGLIQIRSCPFLFFLLHGIKQQNSNPIGLGQREGSRPISIYAFVSLGSTSCFQSHTSQAFETFFAPKTPPVICIMREGLDTFSFCTSPPVHILSTY